MNINCICPAHKCNIMEFFPYFLDIDEHYENIKISPSKLLHELQMSTEERLERLCRPTKRRKLASQNKHFSVIPDIVIFQNFQTGNIYTAKVTLQNLQRVSRHLSIIKDFSPYFEIVYSEDSSSVKVAPGMKFSINVMFKPVEFRDHIFSVKFKTEGETFSVPVHGLGQRPFLSLPDHVSFSPTAVRVPTQKSLILHNFGQSQTCFVATCQEPCTVVPVRGSLKPKQITEMKITCTPTNSRPISTELLFIYEDIKMVIPMSCSIVKANVYLDRSSVIFDETYMGLQSHRKLTAYNCCQFMLEFKWKTCKTSALEEMERAKLVKAMGDLVGLEKKKNAKLEYMNVIDAEGHSAILDQELTQEIKDTDNRFMFQDGVYSILPVEGKILPNQSLEFTIIFAPRNIDYYTEFAYFDVTGKDERIPVCLSGGGKGPHVVLNTKTLNVNDIFLDSTHEYQVVVKNDGNIPAIVSFVENKTEFGGVIKCKPKRYYLSNRDICKSFVISFTSKFQGKFVEKIQFMIEESKEFIDMLFIGNVVCPLLKTDTQDIDFGEVSFGSQPTKEFMLINDSQVPIDFKLHIVDNKNGKEIELEEIDFVPPRGIVEAHSSRVIKVTLTTQAIQNIEENLVVLMWGSRTYSVEFPLRYKCLCPIIECVPREVFINFCFLNYVYKRTICLKNRSNVSGSLTYTPAESSSDIVCNLNKTEFLIFPNEEIDIDLTIQTHSLGTHEFQIIFTSAGSSPESICTVICNGQGPVVTFDPEELNFGRITLLQNVTQTLTLINDSPIVAEIDVSTPPSSSFTCNVSQLEIPAEDRREIVVTGYLTDTGKYKENVTVQIANGETVFIPVLGEGVGSSILCEPAIDPEYDAGTLLTYQLFRLKVMTTNLGRKRYKMAWTRRQGLKNLKELDEEDVHPSIFRIEPNRYELGHNESQQIEIIGSSKKVQAVQEDFHCFAIIDKSTKLTRIISCLLRAEFVEPNVRFSEWSLNFLKATDEYPNYFRKSHSDSLSTLIDYDEFYRPPVDATELTITNDTEIPLKMVMRTTSDYYINNDGVMTNEVDYELDVGDNYQAQIEFRPNVQSNRYKKKSGRFTVDFTQHPKEDNVNLTGEVMYPTINLVPDEVDFECLPLDSYTYTNILIQNITFIPLKYSWELLEDSFEIEKLEILSEPDASRTDVSTTSYDSDEKISVADDGESVTFLASTSDTKKKTPRKVPSKENHRPTKRKIVSLVEVPSIILTKRRSSTARSQRGLFDESSTSCVREEIHVDWENETYETEAKKVLKNIVEERREDEDEEFPPVGGAATAASSAFSLRNIVSIEPSSGTLAPFEYGVVTVGFFPPRDVKVGCVAACRVEGGEEELFSITGMSSRISYKFDKHVIECGRKLYSELWESTLVLTNDGYSKFDFKELCSVDHCYINMPPGWLNVHPSEGCLRAGESVNLSVRYFPGKTGEFWETISFEIGYLEHHDIQIHGYASFAQLSLTLPREIVPTDWNDLSYRAISSITESYLLSFNDIKGDNITKYERKYGCPDDMSEASYKWLLKHDWVVISENNVYPTAIEIDLATERALLNRHLRDKPSISTQSIPRKTDTTPVEFAVPPYVLDFGHVMINRPVCYTVLIVNCGPADTEVRLADVNKKRMDNSELKIEFRPKRMAVGDLTELFVIFSPSRKRCGAHGRRVEECIFLGVKNGGRIPILIRAAATTPAVRVEYSSIEFGTLNIGSALRKSIIIQNDGNLLSKWSTEVRSLNAQIANAYHIIPNKGELSPGKKDLLNIFWVPTKKGTNESELTIRVERNSLATSVELYGNAIEPTLTFNETKLDFQASLPYSETIDKVLIVQNTTASALEYCFSDMDRDYDDEKHHIELYLLYHNYDSVLIPERLPGYRLPEVFQSNFYFLMNQIRDKLMPELCEVEGSFDMDSKYDRDEIFRLLIEHIESAPGGLEDSKTDVCSLDDDDNSKMAIIDPEKRNANEPPEQRSGVFIIFHGGPNTSYYKAACRAGIALSVPVYSIDRLISEELVENVVEPAIEINEIMQSALQGYGQIGEKLPEEDDYDFLWRKIVLFSNKKKKPSSGKLPTTKNKSSLKSSDKKSDKSDKSAVTSTTLMDIPIDLLIDLLRKRFENTKTGLIIESLNSQFIRKPNIAFDALLRAFGSVRYIHVIILSYTLEDYLNNEVIRRKNEDQLKAGQSKEHTDTHDTGTPKSGKGSARSKLQRENSKNYIKQVTKDLHKDMKLQFEAFRELLDEILHICEFWERRHQVLTRPFSRGILTPKKELKFTAKDSMADSKSSIKRGKKTPSTVNFFKTGAESAGISLWAICNCNDDRMIDSEIISATLKCNPELNEAIAELKGADRQIEESTTTFSVVRSIKKYTKNPKEYFQIAEVSVEKQETLVHLVGSSAAGPLRKKSSKRKASVERKNIPLSASSFPDPTGTFRTRHVLFPGDKTKYQISFSPPSSGEYNYNYAIELVGTDRQFAIQCSAICQLPAIDWNPKVVFPKCQETYRNKILGDNFVYYVEEDVFDFGYIFVGTHKTQPYATRIVLENNSQLLCEVAAQLAENSPFVVDQETLSIAPKQSEKLSVTLKASKKGRIQSELFVTVKNNPKVKVIRMAAQAGHVEFNVHPKALSFEKVPLHYTDKRRIALTNSSPVNLFWKFAKAEWTLDFYNISKMSGNIKLYSVDEIVVDYFPTQEESNPKKSFDIQVFDLNHSDTIPIHKDELSIVSDSVVYQVEYKTHIDLGHVRGKTSMKFPYHMTNQGKANVTVVFTELDNILPDETHHIRKFFKMNTKNEVILPQKSVNVMITFHPTTESNFENVPVYNCSFVENSKPENIISSFVITFSGVVHLSKFELCPVSDLYFGYQKVGTAKSQKMEIRNVGKFSFEYAILSSDDTILSQMKKHKGRDHKSKSSVDVFKRLGTARSRTPRSPKSPKGKEKSKEKVVKTSKLEVAGFVIHSSTGTVWPNEVVQIDVECVPKELGEHERGLVIFVTECQKEDSFGRAVALHVDGAEPRFNFDDYEKMFREQFVVQELADFTCPENIGAYAVFVASETALHVRNICINKNYTTKIYLQNLGQVVAEAAVKLEQKNEFAVYPSTLSILPYETEAIFISFTPDSINKFENSLIISYNSSVSSTFVLSLIAESCVPQICLLEPKRDAEKVARIDFAPTYAGTIQSRRICVENVGFVPCKLIMDLCDDKQQVFHLVPQDDAADVFNLLEKDEDFDEPLPSLMVNLLPKKKGYFDLFFKPTYEKYFEMRMKIHIVNNPFEIITIDITGHSYYKDVHIERLESLNLNKNPTSTPYIAYVLDFGFSSLNKLLKKCFTLKNNSESNIYKFDFGHESTVTVTPKVGHLKPNTSKEIVAVVSTKSPLCLRKVKIDCNFINISYVEPDTSISWDDRQQLVDWERKSDVEPSVRPQYYKEAVNIATRELTRFEPGSEENTKCILYRSEPEHILLSNVWDIIPIFFSITADYATYECAVKELIFPDTFVKEKSRQKFIVANTGMVPVHIEWYLTCDEMLPLRASSAGIRAASSDPFMPPDPSLLTSLSSTTLFSSADSKPAIDDLPFEVSPQKAVIATHAAVEFDVAFSPTVSLQYYVRLISNVASLHPALKDMEITVTAEGLVPDCYLEIDDTDYLTRRPPLKKCVEDMEDAKVVELTSVGIGVTSTKTFNVVNTSDDNLSFNIDLLAADNQFSCFNCKTPNGVIRPRKKTEVAFGFAPQGLGTFEEYYKFSVDSINFHRKLLLAGHCREPRVYFDRAHVTVKPTLLGVPAHETVALKNDEDVDLDFKFLKHNLYNREHDQRFKVAPVAGTVNPRSEIDIKLIYNAEKIGETNFYLKCAIEKMKSNLNLTVNAKCLEVLCSVCYTNKNGVVVYLDSERENVIDLGNIGIKLKRITKVTIANTGQTGFFYSWKFNRKALETSMNVMVDNEKEFVSAGGSMTSDIIVESFRPYILKDFRMKLEITYGPSFVLKINAAANEPLCKFSFTSYDFGCCIVQKNNSKYYEVALKAKNFENTPIMIQNQFDKNKNLTVDFKTSQVLPNSSGTIPMYFHPQAVGKYELFVPFTVKSMRKVVKIEGEGVKLNLQLLNPSDKFINLEPVKLGSKRKYAFELLNRTPTKVAVILYFSEEPPVQKNEDTEIEHEMVATKEKPSTNEFSKASKRKVAAEMKAKKSEKNLDKTKSETQPKINDVGSVPVRPVPKKTYLTIHPKEYVTIEPGKKHEYVIEFSPKERMEKFSEKIFYKVQDYSEQLCVVRGCCKAPEFALDKDILTFSNIVIGCCHTTNVLLMNTGDTQGRFRWGFEEPIQDYKLHPIEGIISPNSEIKMSVIFKPNAVYCQLIKKAKCTINKNTILELRIIGNSLNLPQPIGTVKFSCPVRETATDYVNVPNNNTQFPWTLNPILSKDTFWAPREIKIEPGINQSLEIQYRPQSMTKSKPDQATVLLALPEGQAVIYDLIGTALPPSATKKLYVELRCKENHTETLKINNWQDSMQCFEVKTELMSKATPKTIYKTFGHSLVELPPNKTLEYKWSIYVMNEESLEMKVIFTNTETGEYLFYEMFLKVLPSDPLDTIKLITCVREQVKTTIPLKNPINFPVTFNISGGAELQFEKIVIMQPYTAHDLDVFYCPLKSEEVKTSLEVTCEELGTFVYLFELSANYPSPEKGLKFKAELGDKGFNTICMKNTFSMPFEFTAKFDHPVFSAEKLNLIPVGDTGKIIIRFEPSELGVLESRAVLTSPVTGDYIYPLIGECVHPTPKGPFFIKHGGSVSIQFENPFTEQKTFEFAIDSNVFVVKSTSEVIKPRKSTKVIVSFPMKSLDGTVPKYPFTAKLVAQCSEPDLRFIRWVFYIQSDH